MGSCVRVRVGAAVLGVRSVAQTFLVAESKKGGNAKRASTTPTRRGLGGLARASGAAVLLLHDAKNLSHPRGPARLFCGWARDPCCLPHLVLAACLLTAVRLALPTPGGVACRTRGSALVQLSGDLSAQQLSKRISERTLVNAAWDCTLQPP